MRQYERYKTFLNVGSHFQALPGPELRSNILNLDFGSTRTLQHKGQTVHSICLEGLVQLDNDLCTVCRRCGVQIGL